MILLGQVLLLLLEMLNLNSIQNKRGHQFYKMKRILYHKEIGTISRLQNRYLELKDLPQTH